MAITSRKDFTDYCLRRLGFPVIEINVDEDQVQDRIDDALLYYQDYHFDSLQKVYYVKRIDQTDMNNRYINLDPAVTLGANNLPVNIVGVSRVFPIYDSMATVNMFDLRYQLRLNELYDFTSASYINYTMTMQHLRTLELLFSGEIPIRFQRHMHRLYVDTNWGGNLVLGSVVVAECYATIDPNYYTSVYEDRWLKEYATCLIKRQWGSNLLKFADIQLPGGVKLNGQAIFDEANKQIDDLEQEMILNYGGVLEWYTN